MSTLIQSASLNIGEGLKLVEITVSKNSPAIPKAEQAKQILDVIGISNDPSNYQDVDNACQLIRDFLDSTDLNGFAYAPFAEAVTKLQTWKQERRKSKTI